MKSCLLEKLSCCKPRSVPAKYMIVCFHIATSVTLFGSTQEKLQLKWSKEQKSCLMLTHISSLIILPAFAQLLHY
jgi:hypothetical protein